MSKTILMIDDDQDFTQAVKDLLEARGYSFISACEGDSGLARAKEERPDLILLDVMMTHSTEGFDLSRRLRDDPATKDIPVLLVTGIRKETNISFKYEPDEVWLPVRAVIEKPINPERFLKTIEQVFA